MKKLTLTILLISFSASVLSIPNVWTSGYAQGWSEYIITNNKGDTLLIACNIGAGEIGDGYDHNLTFTSKSGKKIDRSSDNLEVLINGINASPGSMPTYTRNGANGWASFKSKIQKGKTIEIYISNQKVATFKPTAASRKELNDLCDPMD